jgi:hypothetical protein
LESFSIKLELWVVCEQCLELLLSKSNLFVIKGVAVESANHEISDGQFIAAKELTILQVWLKEIKKLWDLFVRW